MSLKKEIPVSPTAVHEVLDFEADNGSVKRCAITLKNDGYKSVTKSVEKLEENDDRSANKNFISAFEKVTGDSACSEKDDGLEEGEILDDDSDNYPDKKICEYFKSGRCYLDNYCSYLHVTDKGLYRMLEIQSPTSSSVPPPIFPSSFFELQVNDVQPVTNSSNLYNNEPIETSPTAWDRALEEAKKVVEEWDANQRSNPTVITIEDSENEYPSYKSPKKPLCYKSPEPEWFKLDSSLSANFDQSPKRNIAKNDGYSETECHNFSRLSPKRNIDKNRNEGRGTSKRHNSSRLSTERYTTENKNKGSREDNWYDPWRRSPVHKSELPVSSSKNRWKKSSARSSSSECSCSSRRCRSRRQNRLRVYERRRHENSEVRHKTSLRRSSSSSFSPTLVYGPREDKREAKEKRKIFSPISKKDPSSFTPTSAENRHKAISRRSFSRSPSSISTYQIRNKEWEASVKKVERKSPKSDRNLKTNKSTKNHGVSFTRGYSENWHKDRRFYSRSPSPVYRFKNEKSKRKTMSQPAKESEKKSLVENKSKSAKPNDSGKRDLPLKGVFTHVHEENRHRTIAGRSSTKSPSKATLDRKFQSTECKNSVENNLYGNFNTKTPMELELPLFAFTSSRQFNDAHHLTSRKTKPPLPPADNCSDMSISPYSDAESLNDEFDPEMRAKKLNKSRQRDPSRSPTLLPPPELSQPVAQRSLTSRICTTGKKATDLSKPKVVKKQNTRALVFDLLKFKFPRQKGILKPSAEKNRIQKTVETKADKPPTKDSLVLNQRTTETNKNEVPKEVSLDQRKENSRKEMLLKQLEAINAAIERKKKTDALKHSLK